LKGGEASSFWRCCCPERRSHSARGRRSLERVWSRAGKA